MAYAVRRLGDQFRLQRIEQRGHRGLALGRTQVVHLVREVGCVQLRAARTAPVGNGFDPSDGSCKRYRDSRYHGPKHGEGDEGFI